METAIHLKGTQEEFIRLAIVIAVLCMLSLRSLCICGYGIQQRHWVDDKDLWVISLDIEAIEIADH